MNADERGLSNRAVHVAGILRGVAEETIDGMDRMAWRAALLAAARIVEEDDNRRITEAPAPADAREALAELAERIGRAADSVTTLAASSVSLERVRLEGKAQGLRLAESYADDATRLSAALSPTAPTDAREALARVDYAGRQIAHALLDDRVRPLGSDRVFLALHNAQNALAEVRTALAPAAPDAGQLDADEIYLKRLEELTPSAAVRAVIAKIRADRKAEQ